jgi:uncharacterized protein (DUF3084 family)
MTLPSGEAIGGWATALALVLTAVTSYCTYRSQDDFNRAVLKFNEAQLKAMSDSNAAATEGVRLQVEAAKINRDSANAQREAAAVDALGRYLEKVDPPTQAWASAEAIIDIAGDDPAWQATARRAIKMHPSELKGLECELYSDKFLIFAAETFRLTKEKMCATRSAH